MISFSGALLMQISLAEHCGHNNVRCAQSCYLLKLLSFNKGVSHGQVCGYGREEVWKMGCPFAIARNWFGAVAQNDSGEWEAV